MLTALAAVRWGGLGGAGRQESVMGPGGTAARGRRRSGPAARALQRDGVQEWKPSPVDVAAVRDQLGYTQEQFASRFGISVATLRHWERGDRRPNGPALVLLNLIARAPQAVGRLLRA